jgi:hypothetical protein
MMRARDVLETRVRTTGPHTSMDTKPRLWPSRRPQSAIISSHHPKFRIRASSTLGKPLTIRLPLVLATSPDRVPRPVNRRPDPNNPQLAGSLFLEDTRPPRNAGTSPSLQKVKKQIGLVQSPTKLHELCAQSRTKRRHQTSAYWCSARHSRGDETAATLWPAGRSDVLGYPFAAQPVHVRVRRHGTGSAWPGRRWQLGLVGRPLPYPLLRSGSIPHRTRLHVRRGRGGRGRRIARPDHHRGRMPRRPHDPSGLLCGTRRVRRAVGHMGATRAGSPGDRTRPSL